MVRMYSCLMKVTQSAHCPQKLISRLIKVRCGLAAPSLFYLKKGGFFLHTTKK